MNESNARSDWMNEQLVNGSSGFNGAVQRRLCKAIALRDLRFRTVKKIAALSRPRGSRIFSLVKMVLL